MPSDCGRVWGDGLGATGQSSLDGSLEGSFYYQATLREHCCLVLSTPHSPQLSAQDESQGYFPQTYLGSSLPAVQPAPGVHTSRENWDRYHKVEVLQHPITQCWPATEQLG